VVRIDGVRDELLVFLVPGVEVIPGEGDVVIKTRRVRRWLNRFHAPQPIPGDVSAREEVARERPMPMEQLRIAAVDHGFTVPRRADPARRRLDEHHVAHGDVDVEPARGPVTEGP
jgi:hypothetical protein